MRRADIVLPSVRIQDTSILLELRICVRTDAAERLQAMLDAGCSADFEVDANGRWPLHWAAHKCSVQTIDVLLSHGASIEARDSHGETPLLVACSSGEVGVARRLLEAGADPNARSCSGFTPLHHAAARGNATLLRALLERGADPTANDNRGCTPFDATFEPNILALLSKGVMDRPATARAGPTT